MSKPNLNAIVMRYINNHNCGINVPKPTSEELINWARIEFQTCVDSQIKWLEFCTPENITDEKINEIEYEWGVKQEETKPETKQPPKQPPKKKIIVVKKPKPEVKHEETKPKFKPKPKPKFDENNLIDAIIQSVIGPYKLDKFKRKWMANNAIQVMFGFRKHLEIRNKLSDELKIAINDYIRNSLLNLEVPPSDLDETSKFLYENVKNN